MSEKRFEYGEGTEGPLIYDNKGVDDYYFLNNPKEMEKFIKLLNSDEEYWQEKYKSLSNAYKKQLKLNIEQDREIRQLKEEIKQYKDNLRMCHEKALYWRNKAENIFGDMKTNVELQQENIRLKKELEKLKS